MEERLVISAESVVSRLPEDILEYILQETSNSDRYEAVAEFRRRLLKSEFNPYLLFVSGPGANNLVLSFFLSNPDMRFSREDVFAHLNRHCEEQGITEFFESQNWIGYEFSTTGLKTGLKIGRSSVLRTISNLERLGLLRKNRSAGAGRGKYRLADNNKVSALIEMSDVMADDGNYRNFKKFRAERGVSRGAHGEVESFHHLVQNYIDDLNTWDASHEYYRSKLARLSFYCEYKAENFSTLSREWNGVMEQILLESSKDELISLIRRLDSESFRGISRMNKQELVEHTKILVRKLQL